MTPPLLAAEAKTKLERLLEREAPRTQIPKRRATHSETLERDADKLEAEARNVKLIQRQQEKAKRLRNIAHFSNRQSVPNVTNIKECVPLVL